VEAVPERQLVLVRHGESTYNASGRFTGLLDVPLSTAGHRQAVQAGQLIRHAGLTPTSVYTSLLARAVDSADVILDQIDSVDLAPTQRWELNERNYGELTGRLRSDVRQQYGEERFFAWRRTVDGRPPALDKADLRHPLTLFSNDPRIPLRALTGSESLRDVIGRVAEFLQEHLQPALVQGGCVVVVGHGNSLRALSALINQLTDAEVEMLNVPTGQPLVYQLDQRGHPTGRGGRYLDPGAARRAGDVLAADGGT